MRGSTSAPRRRWPRPASRAAEASSAWDLLRAAAAAAEEEAGEEELLEDGNALAAAVVGGREGRPRGHFVFFFGERKEKR